MTKSDSRSFPFHPENTYQDRCGRGNSERSGVVEKEEKGTEDKSRGEKRIVQEEEQERWRLMKNDHGRSVNNPTLPTAQMAALTSNSKIGVVAFVSSPAHSPSPPTTVQIVCDESRSVPPLSQDLGDARQRIIIIQRRVSIHRTSKISNKSIANDRHGVSCVCFFLGITRPRP